MSHPSLYPPWCAEIPGLVELLQSSGQSLPVHPCLSSPPSPPCFLESPPSAPGEEESISRPQKQFANKFYIIREDSESYQTFLCDRCGPSKIVWGRTPRSLCGHYESCTECQTHIIKQIMRCADCCREVTGTFPVCDENCEMVSRRLSQTLSTTKCPQCEQKLAKDGCGKGCLRKVSAGFEHSQRVLQANLAVMVLHPSMCANSSMRPCSHYSRCTKHGTITRGRAYQRCPRCRKDKDM